MLNYKFILSPDKVSLLLKRLAKIKSAIVLLCLILFSCDSNLKIDHKKKIAIPLEMKNRVNELISDNIISEAKIFNKPILHPEGGGQFFHLDSLSTGINFKHNWRPDPNHREQIENSFIAAGVAIGDYDNDGFSDIFLSRQEDGGRLYKNLGDMQFEDVSAKVGIVRQKMWSTGVSFVDINNDGWLDIYVCGFDSPNLLYINQKGKFKESARDFGLNYKGASVSMAFSDYDNDGDLDAYLLTNRLEMNNDVAKDNVIINKDGSLSVHPDYSEYGYFLKPPGRVPALINAGEYDYLYRNDNGYFIDVTVESGIGKNAYYGLSSTWWDYNNDGRPDLYVANDFMGPDHLFQNMGLDENGITQFKDIIKQAVPYTPWFSMGSDYSDINNDGKMDFMASDMAGSNHYRDKASMGEMSGPDSDAWFLNFPNPPQYMRNTVYLNTGTERFMEVAYLVGLAATDWTWTVKFGDLDNDGFEDVYFTNGMSRDFFHGDMKDRLRSSLKKDSEELDKIVFWEMQDPYYLSNMVYKNLGDLKFKDVSSKWNLDHFGVSTGSALGDLDNDGDLDIVMNGFNEPVRVYLNNLNIGNAIRLVLQGKQTNKKGIGARIEMEYDNFSKRMLRYISNARGFMSSSEDIIHFGLGDQNKANKIRIFWPSGIVQELQNIPAGYTYTIIENDPIQNIVKEEIPMFGKDNSGLADIRHREKVFNDFERENLLPSKLSQLGPGMSWGDIDGDGDDDLYVGGASGFPGGLYINKEERGFSYRFQPVFDLDADFEDMGSIFIDPDGDGDLDLFVVSGGVECDPNDNLLNDRIYINDGYGNFFKGSADLLPNINSSGGVVAAADINKNGRVELFVGGRVIPGSYPESPESYILANSGPRFLDVTDDIAPEIKNAGMVTGATFSDIDGDSWVDLLVTYDWGPIRFFKNKFGKLEDQTKNTGLEEMKGWFNSISSGDIDNDGDTDFIIGNTGYNTKYKASLSNPEILYYGDFENNGVKQIVEAKFENDICFPRRGLSCSSGAMPMIKEKFPTFHDFATSSLEDIYTPGMLATADKYEVNQLASGILENRTDSKGNIDFHFRPLPRIVQSSPVYGSLLCDIDGDGYLDIYVVQNFSGPQRETGYMYGGVSQLLLGDGSGNFRPVSPSESGLVVPGDAMSLTAHDYNKDGRVDILVGVNNGKFEAFTNQSKGESYALRLPDYSNGRTYIGAKISIFYKNKGVQLHELYAGSGYLSQSAPIVFIGSKKTIQKIAIQWPDGRAQEIDTLKISERLSLN